MSSAHEQYYDQDRWFGSSAMDDLHREAMADYRLAMTEQDESIHELQDESIDEDDSITPIDHDENDHGQYDQDDRIDYGPQFDEGEDF